MKEQDEAPKEKQKSPLERFKKVMSDEKNIRNLSKVLRSIKKSSLFKSATSEDMANIAFKQGFMSEFEKIAKLNRSVSRRTTVDGMPAPAPKCYVYLKDKTDYIKRLYGEDNRS